MPLITILAACTGGLFLLAAGVFAQSCVAERHRDAVAGLGLAVFLVGALGVGLWTLAAGLAVFGLGLVVGVYLPSAESERKPYEPPIGFRLGRVYRAGRR